jgi:hypothetical protein
MHQLPEMTLKIMYEGDYSAAVAALLSPRATVLQLLPFFSVVSVFADLTAGAPLFVPKSLRVELPQIIIERPFDIARQIEREFTDTVNIIRKKELHEDDVRIEVHTEWDGDKAMVEELNEKATSQMRRCKDQPDLEVFDWVVFLRGIELFFTHSRGIKYVSELCQFVLVMWLLYMTDTKEQIRLFVIALIVVTFPFIVSKAISVVVIVGTRLHVLDKDITYFFGMCYSEEEEGEEEDESPGEDGDDESVKEERSKEKHSSSSNKKSMKKNKKKNHWETLEDPDSGTKNPMARGVKSKTRESAAVRISQVYKGDFDDDGDSDRHIDGVNPMHAL